MGRLRAWLFVPALLGTFSIVSLGPGLVRAQDSKPTQTIINPGDAIANGFCGILERTPGDSRPAGDKDGILSFIDLDGAAIRGFNLSNAGATSPFGQPLVPEYLSVTARDVGQAFGLAPDNAEDPATGDPAPNIYAAATSVFGLPNGGAALGNIAFDPRSKQLFVSERDTGLIHRLDLDGNVLEAFDRGVTGRGANRLDAGRIDAVDQLDITRTSFRSSDPATWGLPDWRRRDWGLAVHQDRLYYAVAEGPQIRAGGTVKGKPSWTAVLGLRFPHNCTIADSAGVGLGRPEPGAKSGCTDYEFTITNKGEAASQGPMTLRVSIPPGSKFAKAHGKVSVPTCSADGWSCTLSNKEIVCRSSACKLRPDERVSVLTDITLIAQRVHIPPKGLPKTVCGELEWFAKSDPSDIEQQGERQTSRACGTTLVLLNKQPKTDLQIATNPQGRCAVGQTCWLRDEITNIGTRSYSGTIVFQGQVQPPVSIRAIRPIQSGWSCRTTGSGRYTCQIARTAFAPGASAQFQLALALPQDFQHRELTHSVRFLWPHGTGDAKPGNDQAAVTLQFRERAVQPAPKPMAPCTGGKVRVGGQCACLRGFTEYRGRCFIVR